MRPRVKDERTAFPNGPKVLVADIRDGEDIFDVDSMSMSDSDFNEDGELGFMTGDGNEGIGITVGEANVKIKAMNLAINMAKLMSGVTTDDIIDIAKKVVTYIK